MFDAVPTDTTSTARILNPDDVIRRIDELRRELEASVSAIVEIYGEVPWDSDEPQDEGICDVTDGYQIAAKALSGIILDCCPCSIDTLATKATLIEAIPPKERTEDRHGIHANSFAIEAAHVLDPDSRRLAVVRSWGRHRSG